MLSTEDELRGAIGGHELRVQFQPIVSLEHGATIGCEALVRWEHPIRGMVGPGDFVSIAEETGLISKIGRIVLEQACRQAAQWKRHGRDLFVSVNISPRQLTRPDLAADISHALTTSGLPADLLCLEVTETALLRDPGPIVESLRRLRALGVRIAIDDFGAGRIVVRPPTDPPCRPDQDRPFLHPGARRHDLGPGGRGRGGLARQGAWSLRYRRRASRPSASRPSSASSAPSLPRASCIRPLAIRKSSSSTRSRRPLRRAFPSRSPRKGAAAVTGILLRV